MIVTFLPYIEVQSNVMICSTLTSRTIYLVVHTVIFSSIIITGCALIHLRLTFGGSSSPAEWCIITEILTDLANDIMNNPHWNHSKNICKRTGSIKATSTTSQPTIRQICTSPPRQRTSPYPSTWLGG